MPKRSIKEMVLCCQPSKDAPAGTDPPPQPVQPSQPQQPTTTPGTQPQQPSTTPGTQPQQPTTTPGTQPQQPTTTPGNQPQQPTTTPGQTMPSKSTGSTLTVNLTNATTTSPVYAYITGQALDNNNAIVLVQSDGSTLYYPSSPSSTGQPLAAACDIDLGAPGNTRTCTIPHIAGGRIWFSVGAKLNFLLNPGPALVEPSVQNPSDPNINILWGFSEFTYNNDQLFANISAVDFFSVPISLTLVNTAGARQHVAGTDQNGLQSIVNGLNAQHAQDNAGWDKLVVNGPNGQPLRVLSPNSALGGNANLFGGYFDPLVNEAWTKFATTDLRVDTQAGAGTVTGRTTGNTIVFSGGVTLPKPTTADIFSNSTGTFNTAGVNTEGLGIIPRLAAAFNRSTILLDAVQPDGVTPAQYYQSSPTNHYSRILHDVNLDKKGYAFPYDDVSPNDANNVAGVVFDGSPQSLTVAVGGNGATAS